MGETPRAPSRRSTRSGRALLLPLALAGILAAIAGLWMLAGRTGEGVRPVAAPRAEGVPPAEAPDFVPPAAPGTDSAPRATVTLPPDSPYRLTAAPHSLVRGRITAPSWLDWPPEVLLELTPQDDPGAEPRSAWATHERPDFRFEKVPFGPWRLRMSAPGVQEQVLLIATSPEVPDVSLVVPLQPATYLRGRVLDEAGRKVADIRVTARFLPDQPRRATLPLEGATDEEGVFALAGVRPGHYEVHAGTPRSPVGEPREVVLAGGEAWVELVVPVTGSATVRVTDIRTGKPLAGIKVQALLVGSRSRGHTEDARTTADGRAVFAHLPPGEYAFTAWGGGMRRTVERRRVDADASVAVPVAMRALETGEGRW